MVLADDERNNVAISLPGQPGEDATQPPTRTKGNSSFLL
jgi:hypothetical protein